MSGPWKCPKCGTVWSSNTSKCFNCEPAETVPVPETSSAPAPVPPAPFQVPDFNGTPFRGAPSLDGRAWGRDRTFGDLFAETFVMFGTQFHWVACVAAVCILPNVGWQYLASQVIRAGDSRMAPQMIRQFRTTGDFPVQFFGLILTGWLVSLATQAFMGAAIYGTLAAAGRGETPTVRGALRNGANGFVTALLTNLWVGIRLIPWFLLFLIPGIVKTYAWALALPARYAGDADSAENAIEVSASATEGWKLTLFGLAFLLGMVVAGITMTFTAMTAMSPALMKPLGGQSPAFLNGILATIVQAIVALGYWLVYADAISTLNRNSPAVAFRAGAQLPSGPV